jgi:hypothetical protein
VAELALDGTHVGQSKGIHGVDARTYKFQCFAVVLRSFPQPEHFTIPSSTLQPRRSGSDPRPRFEVFRRIAVSSLLNPSTVVVFIDLERMLSSKGVHANVLQPCKRKTLLGCTRGTLIW